MPRLTSLCCLSLHPETVQAGNTEPFSVHTYTYTHAHTHSRMFTHTYSHPFMYMFPHAHLHSHMHTLAHTCIPTRAHMQIYTFTCTHTHINTLPLNISWVWGTSVKILGLQGGVIFHRAQLPTVCEFPLPMLCLLSISSLHSSSTAPPQLQNCVPMFCRAILLPTVELGTAHTCVCVCLILQTHKVVFPEESLESPASPSCFKYCYEQMGSCNKGRLPTALHFHSKLTQFNDKPFF